ncbi:UNVERIFIED_CONTAM: hypothetical protein Slati_0517500 [Sesamum latifolium]|uniref:Endonuclease/exonuclease/phosphatase n=1 Tax=Sesamum latifolium TaxID=2727402 RepID=A0AAW2XZ64_9LAMI
MDRIKYRLDMYGIAIASRGNSGGLALSWDKSTEVVVQSFSHSHIDISVNTIGDSEWWRFMGIYDEPDTSQREMTWQLLRRLCSQSVRAWLCAGDFNELLRQSEKESGPLCLYWQIRNF